MIRSVALVGLVVSTFVACKSTSTNPWVLKKWDDDSLRAWSEECAGTTRTSKVDGAKLVSVSTSHELQDSRWDQPTCWIAWNKQRRRLASVSVAVANAKADVNPDEFKLSYTKQLGMVLGLVPADVATLVGSIARGPFQRVDKRPFIVEAGFIRPGRWELKIELAND